MSAHRSELPEWECLSLVRQEVVGRVCLIDHGCPLAFPVKYRLIGEGADAHIVIRTSPTALIGRYDGPASFEVDHVDLEARVAWSVILRGHLRAVTGGHGLPDPQPLVTDSRHRWMLPEATAITGRRFVGTPSDDGYSVDWEITG